MILKQYKVRRIFKILKRCRSCDSNNLLKIYSNNSSPIGDLFSNKKELNTITNKKYPLNLLLCKKCKLVQLDIIIDYRILNQNNLSTLQTNTLLRQHFKDTSKALISKLNLKKKNKILEILKSPNTFDASLLKIFKIKGYKTLGIEFPNSKFQNYKPNHQKIISAKFNKELVEKINLTYGKYELIIANNILANIDDINSWISNIKNLLSEDGYFIFESSYLLDMVKNKVFDFIYHEHLSYFSMTSVQNLCKRHNLILFDYDHISTKGGSIRFYISKNKNISKRVNKLIDKEKKFKLFSKTTYKKLKTKINIEKKNIQNFTNGKKNLIGFGASISCITLIYQFNLENKISMLVDDNRIKENKFSPGTQIKVLSPKKVSITKKDIVLILPWRFQKNIIKKHNLLLKKAGSVIQIWPKFKIIKV